jgi:paraquat-inducible protein A
MQQLASLPAGGHARCARCDAILSRRQPGAMLLCSGCAALGLLLLLLSCWFPLATVTLPGGRSATSDLLGALSQLRQHGAQLPALAAFATLLPLPALRLFPCVLLPVAIALGRVPRSLKALLRVGQALPVWSMLDVFMLGSLIALFRLRVWMQVGLGAAVTALGGVALCTLVVNIGLSRGVLWRGVPIGPDTGRGPTPALLGCGSCQLLSNGVEGERCPRCNARLWRRKPGSVSRAWALTLAAALLLLCANLLPIISVSRVGKGGPNTILGGCQELVADGLWPLAMIVFTASIIVPAGKIIALVSLLVSARRRSRRALPLRARIFRIVAVIGRWSMLDVYASMTLVALARFAWLGSVVPGPALGPFCCAAVLTMLAASAFDPRLMWDAAGENRELPVQLATTGAPR